MNHNIEYADRDLQLSMNMAWLKTNGTGNLIFQRIEQRFTKPSSPDLAPLYLLLLGTSIEDCFDVAAHDSCEHI